MKRKGRLVGIMILMSLFLWGCDLSFLEQAEGYVQDLLEPAAERFDEKDVYKKIHDKRGTDDLNSEKKLQFEVENLLPIPQTGYAYTQLSEAEQTWYLDILEILLHMESEVLLDEEGVRAGLREEEANRVFQCVLIDHPELFYVQGYTYTKHLYGDNVTGFSFSGTYTMDEESRDACLVRLKDSLKDYLGTITMEDSDYDKLLTIYKTIIENTEYVVDSEENQNIYSVLVNKQSVCQGYAKTFQFLANSLGIWATLVRGNACPTGENVTEPHAWNMVLADGNYYLVDTTWGDPSYVGAQTDKMPEIDYNYFCATSRDFADTHEISDFLTYPYCVEETDNYFVHEGLLFTEYDEDALKELFNRLYSEEQEIVVIKAGDREVLETMQDRFFGQGRIFALWPSELERIQYSVDEQWNTITFWMTNET